MLEFRKPIKPMSIRQIIDPFGIKLLLHMGKVLLNFSFGSPIDCHLIYWKINWQDRSWKDAFNNL